MRALNETIASGGDENARSDAKHTRHHKRRRAPVASRLDSLVMKATDWRHRRSDANGDVVIAVHGAGLRLDLVLASC